MSATTGIFAKIFSLLLVAHKRYEKYNRNYRNNCERKNFLPIHKNE